MKGLIFCLIIFLFYSISNASKNEGEVILVDTSLYYFKIKDNDGNETKFFVPASLLKNAEKGARVQVKYSKTTDGNLKALEIKDVKEKIKKKHKNLYKNSNSKATDRLENPSPIISYVKGEN